MYAKLENGKLVNAPAMLRGEDGQYVFAPTLEQYKAAGYLPVIREYPPDEKDGYYAIHEWVQSDDSITQTWKLVKDMRPLSEHEVNRLLRTQYISSITVDDDTALRMKQYYPEWEDCVTKGIVEYDKSGFKFTYGDKLFSCINPNPVFQADWVPGIGTESMYTEICETHDGTINDPIPYSGNMILYNGKYYTQNDVVYLCTRDSVNPLYHDLSALVGLYVSVV